MTLEDLWEWCDAGRTRSKYDSSCDQWTVYAGVRFGADRVIGTSAQFELHMPACGHAWRCRQMSPSVYIVRVPTGFVVVTYGELVCGRPLRE